jgi:trehalose synthase-fused probable maltokinase
MMGAKSRPSPSRPPKSKGRTASRKTLSAADRAAHAADTLLAWLPTRRWFGAKTRRVVTVTPVDAIDVPGTPGVLALVEVGYADGGKEVYDIPFIPAADGAEIQDAMDDPGFCRAMLQLIRGEASLAGRRGLFRFTPTPVLAEFLADAPENVSRLTGEQSNTSVTYDARAILKLFRKLDQGPNPDFEITDHLTRGTAFRGVPRLLGSIRYEPSGEQGTTLAIVQEFVPNQGDAWTAALSRLGEYFSAAHESGEADGTGTEAFARTLADADATEARRLGALTGQLHMALASAVDPDLVPEAVSPGDLAAWRTGMEAQLDRAMQTLASVHETLPPAVRGLAHQTLESTSSLREHLAALDSLAGETMQKIRIHSDYHLGQVLRAQGGFVIIDFEGEPARPLAERRTKQCALKDVAGMLRSFAYAAAAGLGAAAMGVPSETGLAERLAPWAALWEEKVQAAFLEGYLAETSERGAAFLPADPARLDAALRVFVLDKTLYELQYELNHRPTWVQIPLEGLRRIVTATPRSVRSPLRSGDGPFGFMACLELREFVGLRAENERQLADLIDEVSPDSIYYHTHGFFLRHKFVAGAYPNDFATWTAVQVRDRVLGERLAMVDPANFSDLQALREELVSVIDDHLRDLQVVPAVFLGEPFEFIQSRIVEIPTGIHVRTLEEFREALLVVDVSAIYFHLVEARMRLGRGQNDFAAWLEYGLNLPELAAKARAIDPYAGSLERARTRLVQLCDEALATGGGA